MSIKLLSAVWDYDVTGNTRAVLQVLCDYANDSGVCWPSNDAIAYKVGITKRQVQRILIDLRTQGVVEMMEQGGKGPRSTNRITVNLDALPPKYPENFMDDISDDKGDKGDKGDIPRVTRVTFPANKGDTAVSPEPSLLEPPFLEPLPPVVPRKKTPTKPFLMPDDFTLSDELLDYADSKGMGRKEAEGLFEEMQLWSRSTGGKYLDWGAAFQNWVRRRVADPKRVVHTGVRSKFTREEEDAERLARGLDHIDPSGKLIRTPKPFGGYQ